MRLLPAYLWPRFLKRRLPTSLWGRSLLIIVLPVLAMQIAVTWVFFDAHWNTVTARLSDGLAGDVAWRWHESLARPAIVPLGGWGRPASITFTAGFGLPHAVPHALKQAILLLVARWYDDRAVGAIPDGFDDLVFPFRVRRL